MSIKNFALFLLLLCCSSVLFVAQGRAGTAAQKLTCPMTQPERNITDQIYETINSAGGVVTVDAPFGAFTYVLIDSSSQTSGDEVAKKVNGLSDSACPESSCHGSCVLGTSLGGFKPLSMVRAGGVGSVAVKNPSGKSTPPSDDGSTELSTAEQLVEEEPGVGDWEVIITLVDGSVVKVTDGEVPPGFEGPDTPGLGGRGEFKNGSDGVEVYVLEGFYSGDALHGHTCGCA